MGNGELDVPSGEQLLSCLDMTNEQSSCSFDIDDFLVQTQAWTDALVQTEDYTDVLGQTRSCTHAHACNQSGLDESHTHTCIHVHTKIMPASNDVQAPSDDTTQSVDKSSIKRPLSNREAVRKYRKKKKAMAASLEDEVVRLRALNQQLMKRLQNQALLEAEVARLKCLLVDIRGRIEGELGSFPYKKPVKSVDIYQPVDNLPGIHIINPCSLQCNDQLHCLPLGSELASLNGQGLRGCGFERNQSSGSKELPDCGSGNAFGVSNGNTSSKRKDKLFNASSFCCLKDM